MTSAERRALAARIIPEVLRGDRRFRRLLFARTGSAFGDWYNEIAVLQLAYVLRAGPATIGILLAVRAAATLLSGVVLSPLADRRDRRALLVALDTARALIAASFIVAYAQRSLTLLLVLSAALSALNALVYPTESAFVPTLVPRARLGDANALMTTALGLTSVAGAATGGVVAAWTSPALCYGLNTLTFVWSALLIASIRGEPGAPREPARATRYFTALGAGFAAARRDPVLVRLMLIAASWGIAGGGYYVLIPVLSNTVYHAGSTAIGTLYALDGVGIMAGGLLARRYLRGSERRAALALGGAYIVQGLGLALLAASAALLAGGSAVVLMRIASGVIISIGPYLIQLHTDEATRGRVFALQTTSYTAVLPLGFLATAACAARLGAPLTGALMGGVSILCGLAFLLTVPNHRPNADCGG